MNFISQNKIVKILFFLLIGGFSVNALNAGEVNKECRLLKFGDVYKEICFPVGHKCYDLHGRGDGIPIQINCFTRGSRACNPSRDNWPRCNGGRVNRVISAEFPTARCSIKNHPSFIKLEIWEQFGEIHFLDKSGNSGDNYFDSLKVEHYPGVTYAMNEDKDLLVFISEEGRGVVRNLNSHERNEFHSLDNCELTQ